MARRKARPAAAKRGRPSEFTPELATSICARLATGNETLRAICRDPDMPPESTVRGWVLDDRDGFAAHYERARLIGYQSMADQLLEIADDKKSEAKRSRLQVDTRKWLLAKALPKIYGDKLELDGRLTFSHEDALDELERPGTGDQDRAAG